MIQIDISMPKCCDECFALDEHGDYPFCLISQDQRGYTFNTRKKKMPTCPLKAQEPKKAKQVILQRLGSDALIGYECGNCGKHINQNDKYCHECGQAVKWE